MGMSLPIDVVPGTEPPVFTWVQDVDHMSGDRVGVRCEGALPPSVDRQVAKLVDMAKRLLVSNAKLRADMEVMADRIAQQSELLGKKAEVQQQHQGLSSKKGKG